MYNDISSMAQGAANTFKNSLQYLVDAQNQQKLLDEQAATQRYQNLLTQINQQRDPIQQQYAQDSQGAYINKMLAGKQIGQSLNQLGLNTQGFGVSQMLQNETSYGQNLNQLTLGRNQAVREIDNQVINATGDYNASQLELSSSYAGRLAELQKYIGEQTQSKYNTVYGQLADAKAYEDQLAQIAWENEFKNRQLAEQKSQANLTTEQYKFGGPKTGTGDLDAFGGTPTGSGSFGNSQSTINKQDYFFSNGVQPRYVNDIKLSTTGNKVGNLYDNTTNTAFGNQNIWSAGNKYYVWDSTINNYIDITSQYDWRYNKGHKVSYQWGR